MNETETIRLVPDKQCRRDLDPNDERSDMWWARLQRRYPDIFPPKIKVGRINHRQRDLWEQFKRHLIMAAASAAPDEREARNLEHGRKMGREAKTARAKKARDK